MNSEETSLDLVLVALKDYLERQDSEADRLLKILHDESHFPVLQRSEAQVSEVCGE
jgi:hypothetical protein